MQINIGHDNKTKTVRQLEKALTSKISSETIINQLSKNVDLIDSMTAKELRLLMKVYVKLFAELLTPK